MAGTAHYLPATGSPPAEADAAMLAVLDLDLAAIEARVRAAVAAAGPVPRDRIRAGLRILLDALAEDVERTWSWVAVWPAGGEPELARRRVAVDQALRQALEAAMIAPDAAARLVRDGWRLVHEHLWVEREPDLPSLLGPLMAIVVLRQLGPRGVRDELADKRR